MAEGVPTVGPPPAAPDSVAGAGIVARDREVADLLSAVPRAGEHARAVLVTGPPGVGKSAVLEAASVLAAPVPVRRAVAEDDLDEGELVRLLVGGLGAVDEQAEPAETRTRRRYWARPVLAALEAGPLVLVVEQVDRADGASLAWLDHLLRRAARLPLLLLLSRRTRTRPRAPGPLAELTTRACCRELELGRLDASGTLRLLRAAGLGDVDAETAQGCAELGMGVPRVIRRLADELRDADHVSVLQRVRSHRVATMRDQARAGVAAAPPPVADVVRTLAVLGAAPLDLVAAVAGVSLPEVEGALAALAGEHVIETDPRAGTVALRSPAMREGALLDLAPERLSALRRRAAERLSDHGAPVEEVAAQLMRIPPGRGCDGWMRQLVRMAATGVSLRSGPGAAVAHVEWLTAAARLDDHRVPAPGGSAAARFSELDADLARHWAHVAPERAVGHLTEALAVAAPRTRVTLALELALCLAETGHAAWGVSTLRGEYDRWCDTAVVGADDPLVVVAEVALDHLVATRLSVVRPETPPRPAVAAPLRGATPAVLRALAMRARLACLRADRTPTEAAALARQVLARAAHVPAGTALTAAEVLHLSGASREAGEAHAAAGGASPDATARRALWQLDRGDVAGALRAVGGTVDDPDGAAPIARGDGGTVAGVLARAAALLAGDRPDLARGWLDLLDEGEVDEVGDARLLCLLRSRVALADGAPDLAERQLVREAALAAEAGFRNPVDVPAWQARALLLHDRGRPSAARAVLDEVDDGVAAWPTPRARGLAATVRGTLEGGAAGIATLTDAVALLTEDGSAGEASGARILLGRLLTESDHEREARAVLREAVEESLRLGAPALARRARDVLVVAGGRMRAPTGDRRDALTGTERRVAELAARGATNREVADELVVTLRTVEQHLTHAYRKLGVRGRRGLGRALGTAASGAPRDREALR